ncbi:MAG TPA: anti-sigma factor [Noviherbaspirillum sp.]|uniref:anti-sigma factor family protein n=1 Tax=Noviherbaspirillum sp. TaxID=1926288 RepID=UPI002B46C68C|nr:anti-sigma factor [Noviherbaspirillum sp.]HJV87822.1 anti-sigma factor [Noviherbaspirillum sp.]
MSASPITEIDLHAYVDGQLDAARRAEVEAYLAAHPEAVAEVHAWRTQNQLLHDVFDPVLNEPVPLRFSAALQRKRWPQGLVAGFAWLSCGLVAGWLAHGMMQPIEQPRAFAREALAAHVLYSAEQRHPVEVPAQQEAHLVAWLSKRLSAPIHAPNLREQGFSLLGGRLLPGKDGPLAQLMYESDTGERLTLTVRHAVQPQPETGFKVMEQGGTRAFYWIDSDYGYALSGGIDKRRLLDIARVVYLQLHPVQN